MDRKHRHMKHKDSEEMLSGVTLLEVYSHIHTEMKENEQKEVEDEMTVLQHSLESDGEATWMVGMDLNGKSRLQDLQDRKGNRMDSREYCMI